jgi:type III secretion system low calcium response chaperone LcrH/SycD
MHGSKAPQLDLTQGLALVEYLSAGNTLAESMGQSVESLEALYAIGFTWYNQAKYDEAKRVFAHLMTANHVDRRFSNGFAACLHMQRDHAEAIRFYTIASILDLTDPEPPMHIAECHLALGDRTQARNSINYGLTQARAHKEHQRFVARLESMLGFLDGAPAGAGTAAASTVTMNERQPTGETR